MLVKHSIERTNNVQEFARASGTVHRPRSHGGQCVGAQTLLALGAQVTRNRNLNGVRHNRAERDAEAAASIIRLGAPVTGLQTTPLGLFIPLLLEDAACQGISQYASRVGPRRANNTPAEQDASHRRGLESHDFECRLCGLSLAYIVGPCDEAPIAGPTAYYGRTVLGPNLPIPGSEGRTIAQ